MWLCMYVYERKEVKYFELSKRSFQFKDKLLTIIWIQPLNYLQTNTHRSSPECRLILAYYTTPSLTHIDSRLAYRFGIGCVCVYRYLCRIIVWISWAQLCCRCDIIIDENSEGVSYDGTTVGLCRATPIHENMLTLSLQRHKIF